MRATRRERYSLFSGCRTTLHCWDGIGFEFLEGVSPKTGNRTRTFRGREICKEPENSTFPITMARVISPIDCYGI